MTQQANPDETAGDLVDHVFAFTSDTEATRVVFDPVDDDLDPDDLEFQPRERRKLHWFTLVLIGLIIWGAGFLVGVLVDRSVAGLLG